LYGGYKDRDTFVTNISKYTISKDKWVDLEIKYRKTKLFCERDGCGMSQYDSERIVIFGGFKK
jgi:hypothetical protein